MSVKHSGLAMQGMPCGVLVHCWDMDPKKVSKCLNLVKSVLSSPQPREPATILYGAASVNPLCC